MSASDRSRRPRAAREFACCCFLVLAASALAGPVPDPVAEVLARHRIPSTSVSAFVKEIGADRTVLSAATDVARNPASTMKLVTTMAALDLLGPTFVWETQVLANGPVRDGRLRGDLVLKGGGDPYLVLEDFWKILYALRAEGLHSIDGNLIVDNTLFRTEATDTGAFDNSPYRVYNTLPDALLVNFNANDFVITGSSSAPGVRLDPPSATIDFRNRLKGANGSCNSAIQSLGLQVDRQPRGATVTVSGGYPLGCEPYRMRRSVLPAPAYAYGLFKSIWEQMGGHLAGDLLVAAAPPDARELHSHASRPLAEIIKGINKFSNNVMARQLLLTLGWQGWGQPGTEAGGAAVIGQWIAQRGLNMPYLKIDNGAGLSRVARVSAAGMGRLLEFAARHRYHAEFLSSLALAGIDGTMKRRFVTDPLTGRARIKTGLLNGVRSMAGYVMSASGRTYAVVMLIEHPGANHGSGTKAQDALLRWVYAL